MLLTDSSFYSTALIVLPSLKKIARAIYDPGYLFKKLNYFVPTFKMKCKLSFAASEPLHDLVLADLSTSFPTVSPPAPQGPVTLM